MEKNRGSLLMFLNKINYKYWFHNYAHHVGAILALFWLITAILFSFIPSMVKILNLLEPLAFSWAFIIFFTNDFRLQYRGVVNLELRGIMISEQKRAFEHWIYTGTQFGVVEGNKIDFKHVEIWSDHASRKDVQYIRNEAERFKSNPKQWLKINNPDPDYNDEQ
ncbi:MAG: hypothetical protein AB8G05_18595 [Oligoflexales bacterium]